MNKAIKLYQHLIDELVTMSKKCVEADNIIKGFVPGKDAEKINEILAKLTENDRNILAGRILETYSDAIFDVLDLLEWYACCKDMKISIEGEILPTNHFEGIQNDFIGRRNGWHWPKR